MFNEIGSYFCEEYPICVNYLEDIEDTIFLDSGRSAIKLALKLVDNVKKRVMLPMYTCESVINPFLKEDFFISYYPINKDFTINLDDFEKLIKITKPHVVLLHSFFGFDSLENIKTIISELRNKGIIIIEDLTHNLFSVNDRTNADFYIGSIRKWCGLPDGGFLKINNTSFKNKINLNFKPNSNFVEMRLAAQTLKRKYVKSLNISYKNEYLSLFKKSEQLINRQQDIYGMSEYSRNRIMGIDFNKYNQIRRDNYNFLYQKLNNTNNLILPFSEIFTEEVPLYFPIFLHNNRDTFQQFMINNNIFLPIIWPKPTMLNGILLNKSVLSIYQEILCIPIDFRYNKNELERITYLLEKFLVNVEV